jgi:hypothetical protein
VAAFGRLDGVRVVEVDGAVVRLSAPEAAMGLLIAAVAPHRVVDFVAQPADLEEIFLERYREAGNGD